MSVGAIVFWLVVAGVVVWGISAYNRMVRLRNEVFNALAQIDVQLKRRHDLVPNLVEVARKYLAHESQTLEAVVQARNQAEQARQAVAALGGRAQATQRLGEAEGLLQSSLGRLFAVAEAYPDLKADATMRELSDEITSTENRVGFSRQAYNDAVTEFNSALQQFPDSLIASLGKFEQATPLQVTQSAQEREAVKVSF